LPATWDLRAFDLPPSHREQIAQMLSSVLKGDQGRVQLGPDGRLVVLAPASTQHSLEREILRPLMDHPPPALPHAVEMSYWVVLGRPRGGTRAVRPAGLQEISAALQEIEKQTGPFDFFLLERFRLSSTTGGVAKSLGRSFDVSQNASVADGRVVGDVYIEGLREHGECGARETLLSSRVSLSPGQTAVVGESGLRGIVQGMPKELREATPEDVVFFILRATVQDAAAVK
jgi:hypothetical protein